MTTTTLAPPIDAANVERLISLFTLKTMGARDIMVDAAGALGFFHGLPGSHQVRRIQLQLIGPDLYLVQAGYVDTRTRMWVPEDTQEVHADDLRDVIRELA